MYIFNPNKNKYLVSQLKLGDAASFEHLYNYYYPKIFVFSLRYVKVKEDAEGLTQEVFMELWRKKANLNKELSLSSFLFTIARNKIIDYFRTKEKKHLYNNYLKHLIESNEQATYQFMEADKAYKHVRVAIKELPEKRRIVFLLSKKFGLSRKEIAEFLGISENTVKNQLQEAIKSLRAVMSKEIALLFFLLSSYFFIF